MPFYGRGLGILIGGVVTFSIVFIERFNDTSFAVHMCWFRAFCQVLGAMRSICCLAFDHCRDFPGHGVKGFLVPCRCVALHFTPKKTP